MIIQAKKLFWAPAIRIYHSHQGKILSIKEYPDNDIICYYLNEPQADQEFYSTIYKYDTGAYVPDKLKYLNTVIHNNIISHYYTNNAI